MFIEGVSAHVLPAPYPEKSPTCRIRDRLRPAQRAVDLLLGSLALAVAAPLMAIIAVAIWLSDGGPVFFRQTRIGKDGRSFECLKFRSMVVDADALLPSLLASDPNIRARWARDFKLQNDPRLTPLGGFLRKFSLDELPQFINIVRGDMAVVGPRPIMSREIRDYGRRFSHYVTVRPGLTGLWQVSGRSDTSFRRRVATDYVYIKNRSLGMKVWIMLGTIPAVLFCKGSV